MSTDGEAGPDDFGGTDEGSHLDNSASASRHPCLICNAEKGMACDMVAHLRSRTPGARVIFTPTSEPAGTVNMPAAGPAVSCDDLRNSSRLLRAMEWGQHYELCLVCGVSGRLCAEGRRLVEDDAGDQLAMSVQPGPIPVRLPCPACGVLHVDEGEFATKPHHTHSCQHCGMTWRPAIVATVGVRFLPGFKDQSGNPAPVELAWADVGDGARRREDGDRLETLKGRIERLQQKARLPELTKDQERYWQHRVLVWMYQEFGRRGIAVKP